MGIPPEFTECLARQRAAYLTDPNPSVQRRRADLEALRRMLKDNETAIVLAINADFGVRSAVETRLLELFPVREGIRSAIAHIGKWMRPQKRSVDCLPSSSAADGGPPSQRSRSTTLFSPARARQVVPSWPRPPPTCAR